MQSYKRNPTAFMLALLKFFRHSLAKPCLLIICTFTNLHICILVSGQVNPTSAGERMQGLDQRRKLEKLSLINEIKFRNIGPAVMSGRVADIEVNADDPTEFYVAY